MPLHLRQKRKGRRSPPLSVDDAVRVCTFVKQRAALWASEASQGVPLTNTLMEPKEDQESLLQSKLTTA